MKRTEYVRTLAEAWATDMFISMLNPELRGPKFDFHTFDIEGFVSNMMGTSFPVNKPITDKEAEQAKQHARCRWNRWIKQIGKGLPTKENQ